MTCIIGGGREFVFNIHGETNCRHRGDIIIPQTTKTTWVLIADGARARILERIGPVGALHPAMASEYTAPNKPTREFGTDRPGRVVESADSARHAMEPRVDWHRFEKQKFARAMAEIIDRAAAEKAFDRLVVVAPPKTLGDLRAAIGAPARRLIAAEINKDLTKVPDHALAAQLGEIV